MSGIITPRGTEGKSYLRFPRKLLALHGQLSYTDFLVLGYLGRNDTGVYTTNAIAAEDLGISERTFRRSVHFLLSHPDVPLKKLNSGSFTGSRYQLDFGDKKSGHFLSYLHYRKVFSKLNRNPKTRLAQYPNEDNHYRESIPECSNHLYPREKFILMCIAAYFGDDKFYQWPTKRQLIEYMGITDRVQKSNMYRAICTMCDDLIVKELGNGTLQLYYGYCSGFQKIDRLSHSRDYFEMLVEEKRLKRSSIPEKLIDFGVPYTYFYVPHWREEQERLEEERYSRYLKEKEEREEMEILKYELDPSDFTNENPTPLFDPYIPPKKKKKKKKSPVNKKKQKQSVTQVEEKKKEDYPVPEEEKETPPKVEEPVQEEPVQEEDEVLNTPTILRSQEEYEEEDEKRFRKEHGMSKKEMKWKEIQDLEYHDVFELDDDIIEKHKEEYKKRFGEEYVDG